MKKTLCLFLIFALLFSFAGCKRKKPSPDTGSTGSNQTQETGDNNQPQINTELIAVSVPAVTEDTTDENDTVLSQYTYQHMSLVLNKPEVADKVILDFLNRVDSTKETADATAAAAKAAYKGDVNWVPYQYQITYSPTRIDHSVLSLFGNNIVFTGATHPERTCVSASYDLQTGDVLTLASIMAKDATTESFCNLVLNGLSELAEGDYLYENYKQTVTHRFEADPTTDESWYLTSTGLCFYFAPYEIAPYTSGVITVEIPYEKLNGLLHEAYHPEKRVTTHGTVQITPFAQVNPESYEEAAEIVVNTDGKMYMAQTDGIVQDVRITLSDKAGNYTIFAAYVLSSKNGIMIQTGEELRSQMKLSYKNGKETVSTTIG